MGDVRDGTQTLAADLRGHEDMIHDAQMDFYGTRLATCSSDRSVKIFDVRDGTQTLSADLRGHEGPVWQVAWAHPRFGSILATCSYDRRVVIWSKESDASTQWIQKELHSFEDVVWHVSWSVSGQFLAVSGGDNKVSLWKETIDGKWVRISDVNKGQGSVNTSSSNAQSSLSTANVAQPQSVA